MINDALALIGRAFLAMLLVLGGFQKLGDAGPALGLLVGLGFPGWLIWPALAFNLIAGAGILLGIATRPLALAAAAYCALTSIFHYLPDDPWQMTIFVKNWSLAGGFIMLALNGPGRFALLNR
ncbi:MAG: DoxX family protein [Litoreibacter sp.]|nr:DoxX family protein [Litoreibacter sp.]